VGPLGNVLRNWSASGHGATDNHELRLLPDGGALIMSINQAPADLSPWGGRCDGTAAGNVLQRLTSDGQLAFAWNAFDHLSITATDPLILRNIGPDGGYLDFTHGNAIDQTQQGNYLLSLRHLSQVIEVDRNTGEIRWKLGGVDSDFRFVDDPLNGFSLQHGVRELPNGNLILFDNGSGHQPPISRAVEYRLDLSARTATQVWQYVADPPLFASAMGFAQRLSDGNTLVTYGVLPVVRLVAPSGTLLWELRGPTGSGIYRAFRIPTLY
jgi:hypothetical protein